MPKSKHKPAQRIIFFYCYKCKDYELKDESTLRRTKAQVRGATQGRSRGQNMARLRRSAVFLLLFALALPLSVASKDSRTNHHNRETARPNEPIKQQETQIPLSVWRSTEVALREALQAIKQQSIATEKQAETYKETWDSPSVLVNVALAVIGLGYLIFAGLQWKAINKQATIANETLTETRKAADLAERSLRIMQRAEVSLGRPDGTLAEMVDPKVGEPLKLKIFLSNSGRTAAREFRAKQVIGIGGAITNMALGPTPVRKTMISQGVTAQSGPITSTIASGSVYSHIAESLEALTEQQTDDIRGRRVNISVMGQFEYEDGFGKDEWRAYFLDFDPRVGTFVMTDAGLRRDS